HLSETGFFQRAAGIKRTVAAAADQNNRTIHAGGFFHMRHKVGIHFPVRAIVPRDVHGTGGMTHEQIFHFAAAVDENGVWVLPKKFVRLLWFKMLHGAVAGKEKRSL